MAKILALVEEAKGIEEQDRKALEESLKVLDDQLMVIEANLEQTEKMASLGELAAGIAHEIQNPLNFVNNFAELNKELFDDLNSELNIGNLAAAKAIAHNIEANEERIYAHGLRANAIIKGMLKHSRISSGIKEPTDINELAEEYIRLAYHGLKAKDKSFSAEFKTDFDDSLPLIKVVPQEIGRVLLNLINNAYYTVSEKAKHGIEGYIPTVMISTSQEDEILIIDIKDNGEGIPANIQEKIFQPFFTTKPAGEGTGLGLSLSYDIVTKVHNGELYLFSREGEGSEFIIKLPFQ